MAPKLEPLASTPSCTIDHRTSRTIITSALYQSLKPFGSYLVKPGDPAPAGSIPLDVDKAVYEHCDVHERTVENIRIYDITPRSMEQQHATSIANISSSTRKRKQIYYFAGGGWQNQATTQHWTLCSHIAVELTSQGYPTVVSVVSYPLAPNSPSAVAFPQLEKLYHALLPASLSNTGNNTDTEIVFAGDSAGGNIALALPLHILSKDPSARAPDSLMLMSPAVDLRNSNPEMAVVEKHDPMLSVQFVNETAAAWCGKDMDPSDPRVSPLLGDVTVLAKRGVRVNGVIAGYDVLAPDCVLFVKKCEEAGVRGQWLHWDKQMHCFPLAYKYKFLKEALDAVEWMIEVFKGVSTD